MKDIKLLETASILICIDLIFCPSTVKITFGQKSNTVQSYILCLAAHQIFVKYNHNCSWNWILPLSNLLHKRKNLTDVNIWPDRWEKRKFDLEKEERVLPQSCQDNLSFGQILPFVKYRSDKWEYLTLKKSGSWKMKILEKCGSWKFSWNFFSEKGGSWKFFLLKRWFLNFFLKKGGSWKLSWKYFF